MLNVLFVAAEDFELSPILKRCSETKKEPWKISFAWSGVWNDCRLFLAANGPGPKLATQAMNAVRVVNLDAVVSTGLCGALDPALRLGDIVAGSDVNGHPACLPSTGARFASGTVASIDRFLRTKEEKAAARARGAVAVEMEAAAVASYSASRNVPFYCLRAVSDLADEDFVLDFNELRDKDGRFSRPKIALAAMASPLRRVPELVRFNRRCQFAASRLGEFVASCRF